MGSFCDRHKGAISVFLTLILIPTTLFGGLIVDSSRILGAKNLISGAGDLALNGALSNYNDELNKTYGLLAMANTAEEMQSAVKSFFEASLNASGIDMEDFSRALVYLESLNDGFIVSDVAGTQIYQTQVIKQEILEYMKYRAPVTFAERAIKDRLGEFKDMDLQRKAVKSEIAFESSLDDLQKLFDKIYKSSNELKEIYNNDKSVDYEDLKVCTKTDYEKISVLATAHKRLESCTDTKEGDIKGLMEEMTGLVCDVNDPDASVCSKLIKMQIIKNSISQKGNPNDLLNGLDSDSDEYKELKELIEEYESALDCLQDGRERVKIRLDSLVETNYMRLCGIRENLDEGEKKCEDILKDIEKLKEKLNKSKAKYDNWKDAVNALPEESRSGYTESIEEVKGLFENDGILSIFEDTIENNKEYYKARGEKLDAFLLGSEKLDRDIMEGDDVLEYAGSGQFTDVAQKAREFMNNYHSPDSMNAGVTNKDITECEFYIKLRDDYCDTSQSDKSKEEENTKGWDKLMNGEGGSGGIVSDLKTLMLCDDIEDVNIKDIGDLPTDWLNSQRQQNASENNIEIDGGLDEGKRKKTSENAEKNLEENSSVTQISKLGTKLAVVSMDGMIEPVMLSEYVMGMFSHNTSNKNEAGSVIDNPLSINNLPLKDGKLYRAEIEYIIWGNENLRSNVRLTKAAIFAVNLALNMQYAFTNSETRRDARTVARFFPVGPLGRIAISCALKTMAASAQTTLDMLSLMEGKIVKLLKSNRDWDVDILPLSAARRADEAGFTYDDYVWILVCINMMANQKNALARTADIIEINVTNGKSNMDNTLKDEYTMIQLEASVQIDTFFMQKFNGAGYNVQAVSKEDFIIPYIGIQGY